MCPQTQNPQSHLVAWATHSTHVTRVTQPPITHLHNNVPRKGEEGEEEEEGIFL